ncbi:MAG TPA: HAD family hydrolase [Methylomirabilota bacterium]|nr:HAD family hydrolase [Methylomirabilota bacterium]
MKLVDTLFIDKGGVLVDNEQLAGQWQRLLGGFFPPRLGRTADEWARANRLVLPRQVERWETAAATGVGPKDVLGWFDHDGRQWLYDMCDEIGVSRPRGDIADTLAAEAVRHVKAGLAFDAPRTVDRLRALKGRGLVLHMTSGDAAEDLESYLAHIGARDVFDHVYGSDLVNTWKTSVAYYRAILADTGADPRRTWVIDDSPRAIAWAEQCGMRGFLVSHPSGEEFEAGVLRALDELERALGA